MTPEKSILVVEDNPANRKLLMLMLKKMGYPARAVSCGRDALGALSESRYGLMIMDCQMPDLDGFETTRMIRMEETKLEEPRAYSHYRPDRQRHAVRPRKSPSLGEWMITL